MARLPSPPAVPYLDRRCVEAEASALLAEYAARHGTVIAPPVPVDELLEFHLQLTLQFMDLRQELGGDVLGALWVNRRMVGIDRRLDPDQNPFKLGRYRFTLAHEAGHWRLHRHLYLRCPDRPTLEHPRPDQIFGSGARRRRIEWQADHFAANLLMPRELVTRVWREWAGDDAACVHRIADPWDAVMARRRLERVHWPMAREFEVSAEAMSIRLEELGLFSQRTQSALSA